MCYVTLQNSGKVWQHQVLLTSYKAIKSVIYKTCKTCSEQQFDILVDAIKSRNV